MHTQYPLFQSHLDFSHQLWKRLVKPGDTVIDATAGRGKDSLLLAQLALSHTGHLYAIDIQQEALASTKQRLQEVFGEEIATRVTLCHICHSRIDEIADRHSVRLIVYNLGYLPGSDKVVKTDEKTTLISVQKGLSLLQEGGLLSITCYPGHPEGKIEEARLVEFLETLPPSH